MIHLRNNRTFSFYHLIPFYIWLIFVVIYLLSGCRGEDKKTKANTAHSQIKFEQESYDFGEADVGEFIEHIFKFKNVGRTDLKIKTVQAPCRCTATLLSKDVIQPGGTGQIKIKYKTPNTRGKVSRELEVHCNDPNNPIVSLKLTGIVKVFVAYSPHQLYFASVRRGESPTRSFKIWDAGDNTLQIEKVETSSESLDVQVSNSQLTDGLMNYVVSVRLSPQLPIGELSETVTVYTNNEKKPKVVVPVEAKIVGKIKIWPERLFIGMVKRGQTIIRKIEIDAGADTHFKVEKVESSSEFIKASLVKNNGNGTYQVRIKVDDATPSGILRENLIIHTNSQEEPFIEIDLFGFVKAS